MTYPTTALAASPANHGDVAADVRALGRLGFQVFNARTYGLAAGDDSTDDTAAAQSVEDAASAAGGVVYYPPGTYQLNNITWKPHAQKVGVKGKSILKIRSGAPYLGSCDSGSATTFIDNMSFQNLTFRGLVDTDTTFNQQRHLLNLNGVRNCVIQQCDFIGWHGDAIYLGSSNSAGVERHNLRVKILHNTFDGLTKNNRNCISVIDGDDILVQGNSARQFSRNDMPGFIDVEPNGANTFAICRNIRVIGNHAEDHNQNFFQLNLPATLTTNPTGFLIADNTDDSGQSNTNNRFAYLAYSRTGPIADTDPRQDIRFSGNICRNTGYPVEIEGGINGVTFRNNLFEDVWGGSILGYWNNLTWNVTFDSNEFVRCGYGEGIVHRVEFARNTAFINNSFVNCGITGGGNGVLVQFSAGQAAATSDNTDWISNRITGTLTTAISALSSHTLTANNNRKRLYRENGLTLSTSHFNTTV